MDLRYPNAGAYAYVGAYYYEPSAEKLGSLLDEDVILYHETNDGQTIYKEKGKEQVLEIYEKNLFSNTTDIVVKTLNTNQESKFISSVKLTAKATKENYEGLEGKSRWKFIDCTQLTFVKTADKKLKISQIFTRATVKLINPGTE